jgi:hypothetical protein
MKLFFILLISFLSQIEAAPELHEFLANFDNFNSSSGLQFNQRYLVESTHFDKTSGPIILFLGAEDDI